MFFQRFRPLTSWNLPREHSILCKSPLWAYLRNAALAKTCKTEAKQTNRIVWLCGCKVFFNPCPSGKKNSSTFKSLVGGIQQVATRESKENCWKGTPKQGMLHLCTERLQPSEQCPVECQVEGSSSNLLPAKGISRFQTKVSICINTPLRIIAAWEKKTWHQLPSTQSYTSVIVIIIIIFTTVTTASSKRPTGWLSIFKTQISRFTDASNRQLHFESHDDSIPLWMESYIFFWVGNGGMVQ